MKTFSKSNLKDVCFRAVFISDTHLGTEECRAEELFEFLSYVKTEKLFLVGDIVDLMSLRRKTFWDKNHTKVLRKILKLAEQHYSKKDSDVTYIFGNHEDWIRHYTLRNDRIEFSRIKFREKDVHIDMHGKKFLVIHGDQYDIFQWIPNPVINVLAFLYENTMKRVMTTSKIHKWLNELVPIEWVAKRKGIRNQKQTGCDGIIMGHTHVPKIGNQNGFSYMNCGSWTTSENSATFLAENLDGTWELCQFQKNVT